VLRLGQARLARFLQARSRGQYGPEPARALVAAAKETLLLWGPDGMDFAELAADIAAEAEQAIFLNGQIKEIEERIANLYAEADPEGIIASAPGVGPVTSAVIAGRVGDPHRFTSLAAIRAYSGLVPKTSQSGTRDPNLGLTKAGDPLLREALFMAADHARLVDPQLAAKYVRLMSGDRHRDSAVCHLAANLLTRIAACWRTGQPYVIRDVDGREITEAEGKAIVKARYKIDQKKRVAAAGRRMKQRRIQAADRESQKSLSAPTSRPATTTVDTTPITVEVA
jgi:transposase